MRSLRPSIGHVAALSIILSFGCTRSAATPDAGLTCPSDAGPSSDAGGLACDAPAVVDPSTVRDLASFRAAASAVVCDWSLRCAASPLLESFCHPEFAALLAHRSGADVVTSFDPEAARACVRALLDAPTCEYAVEAALTCGEISQGELSGECASDEDCSGGQRCQRGQCAWHYEGETCTSDSCAPGLSCVRGRCRRASEGCTCASDEDCADGYRCASGMCRLGERDEDCGYVSCGGDLVCGPTGAGMTCRAPVLPGDPCGDTGCDVGGCGDGGVCVAQHHLGCACASDVDCPLDVARCVDGACVARPMVGEACDPAGAPCFGSVCDGRSCRLMRQDEACFYDTDCELGLSCSAEWFGSGLCGAPREEGDACGSDLAGACADGLYCVASGGARRCRAPAEVGDPCSAELPCVDGARCSMSRCVAD